MRKIAILLFAIIILTACSKGDEQTSKVQPTTVPTEAPTPEVTPEAAEIIPAEPFDKDGRAVAMFGTPSIDGTIDEIWKAAGALIPTIVSTPNVKASGEFRVLWDDNALYSLYIVTDPDLNKSSSNAYEQDSIELFLDEMNDKATSYQGDDVHYRLNYENSPSTDAGDSKRFFTAVSEYLDASGKKIGYIVETSLTWTNTPGNNSIMGFDLQINDADSTGVRIGTINIFDQSGTAWQNPSSMGELVLMGKDTDTVSEASPYMLMAYVKYVEEINLKGYINSDILTEPLQTAKKLLEYPNSTQEEFNTAEDKLREVVGMLNDGSGFVNVSELKENTAIPGPFTFFNGDKVKTKEDWKKRADELADLFQYYMYGVVPDTSDEKVSYKVNGSNIDITVEKGDKKVTFPVALTLPNNKKVKMPEGGYPVLIAYLGLKQTNYANEHGYATAILNTDIIAVDNIARTGAFYELYPYGDIWTEQTGALVAWSWGVSKIIDALESGAGAELGISTENIIMTGVSRWGKSAAVAGALEKRIKVTAPSCSGAGGMAMFRYPTAGKVYDYSKLGINAPYTMTANEPLSSLQSSGERHWFNDNFLEFKDVNYLPFDQHLLAALCAEEDRYLFITGSYLNEDWTNPPAMWLTYLAAREVFDFLGLKDNIAVHIHKEGHMVTDEDMVYLLDYCDYHFYGKKSKSNLEDLTTSLFVEEGNYDPIYDTYLK